MKQLNIYVDYFYLWIWSKTKKWHAKTSSACTIKYKNAGNLLIIPHQLKVRNSLLKNIPLLTYVSLTSIGTTNYLSSTLLHLSCFNHPILLTSILYKGQTLNTI